MTTFLLGFGAIESSSGPPLWHRLESYLWACRKVWRATISRVLSFYPTFLLGLQAIRSSPGPPSWYRLESRLWACGKVWRATISGSDSRVLSFVVFVDAGVHIAYADKTKRLVQQLKIVRIADSRYWRVKSEFCVDGVLQYCIGPDDGDFQYPTPIYTCVLVLV